MMMKRTLWLGAVGLIVSLGFNPANAQDGELDLSGVTELSFWIKSDITSNLNFELHSAGGNASAHFISLSGDGVWTQITLPIGGFTVPAWGGAGVDISAVQQIGVTVFGGGLYTGYYIVDEIEATVDDVVVTVNNFNGRSDIGDIVTRGGGGIQTASLVVDVPTGGGDAAVRTDFVESVDWGNTLYPPAAPLPPFHKQLAGGPRPAESVLDVPRDADLGWSPGIFANTHDVYFGTNFADVNTASADNPLGVLISAAQDATRTDPGRLDFDQTYYWRVDEVNGAPDFTVFKGATWSFTTEPFSIPITPITATASSEFAPSPANKTIDGSGLTGDLHGIHNNDMWISQELPASINWTFDQAYVLHEMWIWNSNQTIEVFVGFGAKDVVIEHSLDGENWTVLEGVSELAQAPGLEGYAANNIIDFGGAVAQHVRINISASYGLTPRAGLSEVRFFSIPVKAREPQPASGSADVDPSSLLSWRAGREAGTHDLYLGTDATDLPLVGRVAQSRFDSESLDLQVGQTYHWRVDEVNEAMDPSTWTGDAWSFTTVDGITIDDMESYRNEDFFEPWAIWIDGFEDPSNGSLVGDPITGGPEFGVVHGGGKSLPMTYGQDAAAVSEATRTFAAPMDWTRHGVASLVLYFQGSTANTGGSLYVRINDTKVAYDGDASSLMLDGWHKWIILLGDLAGVDLSDVRSMTIGVDGGGTGVVYVDDITLEGEPPTPGTVTVNSFNGLSNIDDIFARGQGGGGTQTPSLVMDVPPGGGDGAVRTDFVDVGAWGNTLYATEPDTADETGGLDLSGVAEFSFWVKSDIASGGNFELHSAGGNASAHFITLSGDGVWTQITLPIGGFTVPGWGGTGANFSAVQRIGVTVFGGGPYTGYYIVDEIEATR